MMVLFCRICGSKFLATTAYIEEVDSSIVATFCGHLFHKKCLDASITNQKLSHATMGTGPFRRFCPAFNCASEIQENGIIEISTAHPRSPKGDDIPEDEEDMEIKFMKKFQVLTSDKERLQVNLDKLEKDNDNYREALDEIRAECDDISSLLLDDNMIKKWDRVFWITNEGTFAPGRILEMRKKSLPGETHPFAIIKLDRKTKLPSLGTERETAIVPVKELLTFKSFFKEFFQEFRQRLWKVLLEARERMTDDGKQKLLRSKFRESSLRLSIDSTSGRLGTAFSTSHEAIDSISLDTNTDEKIAVKKNAKISRAKSMYFGMQRPKSQNLEEKSRSISLSNKVSSSLTDTSEKSFGSNSSVLQSPTFSISPIIGDDDFDDSPDYITTGERVIYHDTESEYPQVGEVACVLKYTPCAIVKFDQLPNDTQIHQFRTVPLIQLFPYTLASLEEKFKIAEAYGLIDEFMYEHSKLLNDHEFDEEDEFDIDLQEEEEYFSTCSTEENIDGASFV